MGTLETADLTSIPERGIALCLSLSPLLYIVNSQCCLKRREATKRKRKKGRKWKDNRIEGKELCVVQCLGLLQRSRHYRRTREWE